MKRKHITDIVLEEFNKLEDEFTIENLVKNSKLQDNEITKGRVIRTLISLKRQRKIQYKVTNAENETYSKNIINENFRETV